MTKNSDVDSIIKMLRDENKSLSLTGGHEDGLSFAAEAPQDRTTMVVVLGIIAGLVLGALFYYCVMYMPATDSSASACESSLIKEPTPTPVANNSKDSGASTVPKRIKSNFKPENAGPASLRAPKKSVKLNVQKSNTDSSAPAPEEPVENKMPTEKKTKESPPLFSIASIESNKESVTLSEFGSKMSPDFKLPSKPLQPNLDAAKNVADGSSASKLLEANKQLIDATEGNKLRQKLMVATEGLAHTARSTCRSTPWRGGKHAIA